MTNGELHDYVKGQLDNFSYKENVNDWRPASDFYIEDIVKIGKTDDGFQFPFCPYGLRFWLSNGDSIIYIKKVEEKPKKISRDEAIKLALEKSIVGGGGKNASNRT